MAEQETPPRISVCIVCRNESDKLVACLESVSWADEIVVMDLGSEDGSADVARARNAIVLEHEPFPIVEPLRNEIAAVASGEWILVLDPDERISPGLARELQGMRYRTDVDAVVDDCSHASDGARTGPTAGAGRSDACSLHSALFRERRQ
jgi:glycosyltransferase involved in cell wall biosynthesis